VNAAAAGLCRKINIAAARMPSNLYCTPNLQKQKEKLGKLIRFINDDILPIQ
jgi:hypothetical protein